jgi:hypothetical protein
MKLKCIFLVVIVTLSLTMLTFAGVPQLMNYQGRLTGPGGNPVEDGNYQLVFTIYDVSEAAVWQETHFTIAVSEGLFNVLLGAGEHTAYGPLTEEIFEDSLRWLGITVGQYGVDPEISPRARIVTAAYAFRAGTVDGAKGGIISGDVSINSNLTVDGDLNASGKGTIGTGHANNGNFSFIAGDQNTTYGNWATVGGGQNNWADGDYNTIGGGEHNSSTNLYSTVTGGVDNGASGDYSAVGGGQNNHTMGLGSVVSGGQHNSIDHGTTATIGGGNHNLIEDESNSGVISGGEANSLLGVSPYGVVSGGKMNMVIEGHYAAIPGGENNTIESADYSLVFGKNVRCAASREVILFDGLTFGALRINRDEDNGSALGPLTVGTNSNNGNGAYLTAGGTWTNGSSRTFKENFTPFDGNELLSKISSLSVTAYNYKNSTEKHIGPVAEEFVGAFDTGVLRESDGKRDDMYLSSGDVAGVALAGVQELLKKIETLEKRVAELEAERGR